METLHLFDTFLNLANTTLTNIGTLLWSMGTGDGTIYGIDYMVFAQHFQPIFKAFAYSLCLLLIGVNIMESAVQYDLFTLKGAMKIGARLLLSKVWIDISVPVCGYIISIGAELTRQILSATGRGSLAFPSADFSSSLPTSNIPLIGAVVDLVLGIIALIPFLIMVIVVAVIAFCVIVKLVLRTFELAMLISVSPIFFACWVGDSTKQYFRKFIMTFLGVVMQIVFMALVYTATLSWMRQANSSTSGSNVAEWFASALPGLITIIAMGIMMIKPPKILTSLVS